MNKFVQEMLEQPGALQDTLNYYLEGDGKETIKKIVKIWEKGKFGHIIFTGMGSSFFASHSASCLLSSFGIKSFVINAGELLHYHTSLIKEDSLLVCVSQSGESYEVVKILEKLPKNVVCIGIGNEKDSALAKVSREFLMTKAGKEEMTSTKTYVSTLLVMLIFAYTLSGKWSSKKAEELSSLIESTEAAIKDKEEWLSPAMKFLNLPPFIQIVGRGSAYSSVLQGALMFMEAAKTPASGMYGGEFRHGPLEMVQEGFRAVILAPEGNTYAQNIKLAEDVVKFGGKVVIISNRSLEYENPGIFLIKVSCSNEHYFAIPSIVPLQFIVNQWALEKHLAPGGFTRGAKVTVTE